MISSQRRTDSEGVGDKHNLNEQLIDSDDFKRIWRHLHVQLSHTQQVNFSLLPRVMEVDKTRLEMKD